ncbi:hypothetical protein [Microbispora sp. NBRC 16548]|uniref:hypothetical protein n=1 Tax=Microbispora sp. NBRC 16548 TaxID=3030994 RepID=UPI0024A0F643|nr:hypothetical protein [Microbispora sp. NBRC 16548]GLX06760.1 hypothetical protein Misp03_36870 [Microbispora sp. NBRC 16548]
MAAKPAERLGVTLTFGDGTLHIVPPHSTWPLPNDHVVILAFGSIAQGVTRQGIGLNSKNAETLQVLLKEIIRNPERPYFRSIGSTRGDSTILHITQVWAEVTFAITRDQEPSGLEITVPNDQLQEVADALASALQRH